METKNCEAFVAGCALVLGFELDRPRRAAVAAAFQTYYDAAGLIMSFLLADGVEPASVYRPEVAGD